MPHFVRTGRKIIRRSVSVLRVPQWKQFPWLVHGFSTRLGGVSCLPRSPKGGDLNLVSAAWDRRTSIEENRRRFLAALGADSTRWVRLRQIHSDLIRVVYATETPEKTEGTDIPEGPLQGDGLMTNVPGLLLAMGVADCLPILLVDVRQRVVAALHCGWRGTLRRMAQKGVGRMMQVFGTRVRDLRAAIGPGIRSCCYPVGPEVVEEFEAQFPYADQLFERRISPLSPMETKYPLLFGHVAHPISSSKEDSYLNLVRANVCQLQEAGVAARHIAADFPCTCCHPELFFSYRRDGTMTGRMMGVIGIRRGES